MMILVIDITKGVQTQTAECLVIGEITCSKMIVVLNKVDLIPHEKRSSVIEKVNIYTFNLEILLSKFGSCMKMLEYIHHSI